MKTSCLLAVTLLTLSSPVSAQTTLPHNGQWKVSWKTQTGREVEASLSIDGAAGTWQSNARAPSDPCIGRPNKIEVTTHEADKLEFNVLGSRSLAGCPDYTIVAKRVAEDRLEGSAVGQQAVLTFVRAR